MREPSKQLAKNILASIADSDEVYSKQIKTLLPKKQIFKFTFIGCMTKLGTCVSLRDSNVTALEKQESSNQNN